jgi:hypothetical protein
VNNNSAESSFEVVLGPPDIRAITDALETLFPWISDSKYRLKPDGSLEFSSPEPVEAIEMLRESAERFLPTEVHQHLGHQSGLGWPVFFGHVVAWWLPQRNNMGFLRALVDRAALHDVKLRLHWNQERSVSVTYLRPDNGILVWGAAMGIISGLMLARFWYVNPVISMLVAAGGLVGGRVYQRVVRYRVCGDYLCQARMSRSSQCPSCGGLAEDKAS